MIKAELFKQGDSLTGFKITGHSGFAREGEDDIVCASVSSAAYMAANTITDVIGDNAEITVKNGYLSLVSDGHGETQTILKGLELHLKALAEDYPKYIKIKI